MKTQANKESILAISGPTACGKSGFALELAKRLDGELINADSVQFYREFDLGSAKPSLEEQTKVPHHLFSILAPEDEFNISQFVELARDKIREIAERSKVPIVVGGSGLYLRSLLHGVAESVEPPEDFSSAFSSFEEFLEISAGKEHLHRQQMYEWLLALDPKTARRLSLNDLQRVRRALIVKTYSGESLAELQDKHQFSTRPFRAFLVLFQPDRSLLYQAIDRRVDWMLEQGLVAEVNDLLERYPSTCGPFSAIGYRHVREYLEGVVDYERMVDLLKCDTRRFAKRQYTWWNNQPTNLDWREVAFEQEQSDIDPCLERMLEYFLNEASVEDEIRFLRISKFASEVF